jgi:putative oxidoreductase
MRNVLKKATAFAALVVFFPEGIQKLAFPTILGAGRFVDIGIPYPDFMGPFVGVVETVCGALIIFGLFTRIASVPLIIIMVVAIVSTKVPILLDHDFWIFHLPKLPHYGFGVCCTKRARTSPCCSARCIY